MAKKSLAWVLGGGGARGALQVGALRALVEAGIRPDLMVGTSIGAVNAICLALNGINEKGLRALEAAWRDVIDADLLPPNYLWLTVRNLLRRGSTQSEHRSLDFLLAHGLSSDLKFGDLDPNVEVILVSADLNRGRQVLHGISPQESVLEGVLASTALPPWIRPLRSEGRFLIDGGVVSQLPIEAALSRGATEIIALDLSDFRTAGAEAIGIAPFVIKVANTMQQRQIDVEEALAEARGVPVRRITLQASTPVPVWDFGRTEALMPIGYQIMRDAIASWADEPRPSRWRRTEELMRALSQRAWRRAA